MDFALLEPYAIMAALVSALLLMLTQNWRLFLFAIALQYLAAFILVGLVWAPGLAAVKVVVGWMAVAVIGAVKPEQGIQFRYHLSKMGVLFRFIAVVIAGLTVFTITPLTSEWMGIQQSILFPGLMLIISGLLQLGLTGQLVRRFVGVLSVLVGFEIIFASLSSSVLLAGLMAIIHLGVGLALSYWITVDNETQGETAA
jgi:hypothetical protein